jgi:hypothetical protein
LAGSKAAVILHGDTETHVTSQPKQLKHTRRQSVLKTLMLHKAPVIPFPLDHHNCTEPVVREGAVGPIRRSGLPMAMGVRHSGRIERIDGAEISDGIENAERG